MKVFRDIMGAVMVGLLAGFVVSVFSYYQDHKEGGVKQTMLAVVNSFDEVAKAYSDSGESMLLSDMDAQGLDDEVLEAFEQVENGDVDTISQAVFNSIFNGNNQEGMSEDVLAMDGEDGNLDEGAPYSGIMRFHVRANSDTEEDQELKLAVKEDVVNMLKPLLEDCTSVAESKSVIVSNFLTALFATFKDSSVPLYERIFFVNFLYNSTKYITTAITEKIGNGDKKAFIVSSNLKTLYTVSKNQLAIIGTTKINV